MVVFAFSPHVLLNLNSPMFSLHDVRINYADNQKANDLLASKVGINAGSLWSNIATLSYPSGLTGPSGKTISYALASTK